ncbi:hypothetical protein V5O48_012877 [Marasmius crinis-equi]|uniref:Uncharacterized protein n=1 Tax=Marasmius crinis-equi TaxID=585013 RepID=A0ABR3F1N3_9AGAR
MSTIKLKRPATSLTDTLRNVRPKTEADPAHSVNRDGKIDDAIKLAINSVDIAAQNTNLLKRSEEALKLNIQSLERVAGGLKTSFEGQKETIRRAALEAVDKRITDWEIERSAERQDLQNKISVGEGKIKKLKAEMALTEARHMGELQALRRAKRGCEAKLNGIESESKAVKKENDALKVELEKLRGWKRKVYDSVCQEEGIDQEENSKTLAGLKSKKPKKPRIE